MPTTQVSEAGRGSFGGGIEENRNQEALSRISNELKRIGAAEAKTPTSDADKTTILEAIGKLAKEVAIEVKFGQTQKGAEGMADTFPVIISYVDHSGEKKPFTAFDVLASAGYAKPSVRSGISEAHVYEIIENALANLRKQ